MSKLIFKELQLSDYDNVYSYTSRYGEGSCQHSFVSMYSLNEKYGDMICVADGFLYTLRSHLEDDNYRVYLAPLGDGDHKAAFESILQDAHANGKKVKFQTLTESKARLLEELLPGKFEITEQEDLFEYVYFTERMAYFPGKDLRKRRMEANRFWALYGDIATVTRITKNDFADITAFENEWLFDNRETHDMHALDRESRMIQMQFDNFEALHLSGVVLRVSGKVKGFSYGTKLSDEYYDAVVEKGDRELSHVYKVLRQESVKQCALDCTYVNLEEDVGVPGLRALKNSYKPEFILKKYIATEL